MFAEYSKKGWDCNGAFYYMETIVKSAFEEKALPWTEKCGASLLRLQSMDDDIFLRRGEIVPDPDKIEEHVARHGAVTFEVAARNIANNIHAAPINNDTIQIRAIYACLLKIGIIQRKKIEPRRKLEMFLDFLHEELGVFMALEALLACLQFRGRGGSLIPVEAEAKNVRQRLMASAWDLFLLHVPELLISNEGNEHTSVFYVCTAERAIQEIGSMRIVKREACQLYS